ncbi:hypothetical protein RND81_10G198900 [Saponaria officinalis]|uniref:rRNA-processing protein EFG1 n=1 Tax=Saponaria officinalis TaxID=3572 RepID=A0AAW1I6R2_SAPOF
MVKLKSNQPLRATRQKFNNNNNKKNKFSSYKSKLGVVDGDVHKNKINADNKKKSKATSLKNQIRSTQRLLQRDLPAELREAQEKKLEELKKQQFEQNRMAEERKIFLRDRKIKFFERRKIERRMRRMEKQQRISLNEEEEKKVVEELGQLKKDLEYVRFFPKAEKYVPLYCGDDPELVDNRNRLRMQIKANIIAAAASGKELEETGSEDDGPTDLTDDDFFVSGTSSDEADADDELTDLSAREQASRAPTKAALGISKDETIQRQKSARSLMPPPRPQKSQSQRFDGSASRNTSKIHKISHSTDSRFRHPQAGQSSNGIFKSEITKHHNNGGFRHSQAGESSSRTSKSYTPKHTIDRGFRRGPSVQGSNRIPNSDPPRQVSEMGFRQAQTGQSSNRSSNSDTPTPSNERVFPNPHASQSSNISSNSDAPKRRRKRRPKKRKQ